MAFPARRVLHIRDRFADVTKCLSDMDLEEGNTLRCYEAARETAQVYGNVEQNLCFQN